MKLTEVKREVSRLLQEQGLISAGSGAASLTMTTLRADGSSRRFIRVGGEAGPLCVAVLPDSSAERELDEARAALRIGRHLDEAGVPVPKVLAADEAHGLILFEDLGDVRLHDLLRSDRRRALEYYREAVAVLARMQVRGAAGFDPSWCCDTPRYDRRLMLERESGYFLRSFWQETLFGDEVDGLQEEFAWLADQTMAFFEPLFLHRDFQSRNLMICAGRVRVIDFQGGRLGPAAYDLTSLLIDPYAGLSTRHQAELFQVYLEELGTFPGIDRDRLVASYPYCAVQRNLQIIGAFAHLSGRLRKPFFQPFILPALIVLQNRLEETVFAATPVLRQTVSAAIRLYRSRFRG